MNIFNTNVNFPPPIVSGERDRGSIKSLNIIAYASAAIAATIISDLARFGMVSSRNNLGLGCRPGAISITKHALEVGDWTMGHVVWLPVTGVTAAPYLGDYPPLPLPPSSLQLLMEWARALFDLAVMRLARCSGTAQAVVVLITGAD